MIRRWMSIALFLTLLAAGCVPASAAGALRAGDRVQIGYYEQDNNGRNGQEPIWWDVLETSGDRALLISSQALDCMEYYHRNTAVAWRDSTIRNWLMGVFYYEAFSETDQSCMTVAGYGGMNDPLFILNKEQILSYGLAQGCDVTAYARRRGVQIGEDNGKGCWWVRMDVTYDNGNTRFVGIHGKVYDSNRVTVRNNGVRPAMWVSIRGVERNGYPVRGQQSSEDYCTGYTNQKLATRGGPSTRYDETHTFSIPVGTAVKIYRYQVTNGTPWVEVEFEYGGELVRAWTGKKRVDSDEAIYLPGDYALLGSGYLNRSTPGWYGPGSGYRVLYDRIETGTWVDILASQSGWYLIEYDTANSSLIHRAWVPAERVGR